MHPSKCFTSVRAGKARRIKYLDQEQLARLFQAAKERPIRDRLALAFLYKFALRASELTGLRTADVDRDRGRVYVQGLKHGNEAFYRLPDDLKRLCKGYRAPGEYFFGSRQSDRLSRIQLWRIVTDTAKAAGLPDWVTVHSLRHSAAVHALDCGLHVSDVSDLLRHASTASTSIYARISNKRRTDYMDQLAKSPASVKV